VEIKGQRFAQHQTVLLSLTLTLKSLILAAEFADVLSRSIVIKGSFPNVVLPLRFFRLISYTPATASRVFLFGQLFPTTTNLKSQIDAISRITFYEFDMIVSFPNTLSPVMGQSSVLQKKTS